MAAMFSRCAACPRQCVECRRSEKVVDGRCFGQRYFLFGLVSGLCLYCYFSIGKGTWHWGRWPRNAGKNTNLTSMVWASNWMLFPWQFFLHSSHLIKQGFWRLILVWFCAHDFLLPAGGLGKAVRSWDNYRYCSLLSLKCILIRWQDTMCNIDKSGAVQRQ